MTSHVLRREAPMVGRFALVVLAAVLIPIVPFAVVGELPGERWLQGAGSDAFLFGAAGAALLAADLLLPIPSSIIGALLGGRLGVLAGFGWTFAGLCIGNAIGYLVGRLVPGRWSQRLPPMPAAAAVLLSRPVPVLAEAMTLTAGAARMQPRVFVLAVAGGNAVYAGAMAAHGAAWLPQGWLGPGLVVPMAVPVLGWLVWRRITSSRDTVRSAR